MDPKLNQRFPSTKDIEKKALKRMPKFIRDYIYCGMGRGGSVNRNREALDSVLFTPQYLLERGDVDVKTSLFGKEYDIPLGIAPVGMGGLAWPKAAEHLATAAQKFNIPFCEATYALADLETIHAHGGDCSWLQMYRPKVDHIEEDMLIRAEKAGYDVLIVTVDVPSYMRRDHDIRNGFSVPPRLNLGTLFDLAMHPEWSLSMALKGFPEFYNLTRYAPKGMGKAERLDFFYDLIDGLLSPSILRKIRDRWKGTLIVKGVLGVEDALVCKGIGVDGIIVSNHGGRQLEASPSPVHTLPAIRKAVGKDFTLIADSGVRTGLDICRMLALGADFVLAGRPFYYSVAAMGPQGADHCVELLKEEFICVMDQLGCTSIDQLSERLVNNPLTD